jgi:hypothetical protein
MPAPVSEEADADCIGGDAVCTLSAALGLVRTSVPVSERGTALRVASAAVEADTATPEGALAGCA